MIRTFWNVDKNYLFATLLQPKVVFHKKMSFNEGCLPMKVIFHWKLSSTDGRLTPKVIFHRRLSSIEGCLIQLNLVWFNFECGSAIHYLFYFPAAADVLPSSRSSASLSSLTIIFESLILQPPMIIFSSTHTHIMYIRNVQSHLLVLLSTTKMNLRISQNFESHSLCFKNKDLYIYGIKIAMQFFW